MNPRRLPARLVLPARLLLPVAALVLLAACSSSDDTTATGTTTATATTAPPAASPPATTSPEASPTGPAAAAEDTTITIVDFEYEVPTSVEAGAPVTVKNEDSEAHTVTLGGDSDVQLVVQGGMTATFTAPAAGTYPISCDFHGDMTAELVVT